MKENDDVKVISNYLNGKTSRGKCDAFDIIDFLWFNTNFDKGSINCNYNEAISLMTGLIQYDLVKIRTKKETQEDGTVLQYHVYDFKI